MGDLTGSSSRTLLDTHCHVDVFSDPIDVIASASSAGTSIVAVTEGPDEYRRLRTRLGRRENVTVALGLHPLRAASFTQHDLARFFRLVPQATWIGEVGLDFSRSGVQSKRQQLRVFDVVLTEAQPGRHPITVHSRGAEREVVRLLADARLPAILHWYSGPLGPVENALAGGAFFSVNIAMTRSKRFRALIDAVPRERVLLETDGPYARTTVGPARPDELRDVVSALARTWAVSNEEAATTIVSNQGVFESSYAPKGGTA